MKKKRYPAASPPDAASPWTRFFAHPWAPALGCFVLALILRLLYLAEWAQTAYYDMPIIDALRAV